MKKNKKLVASIMTIAMLATLVLAIILSALGINSVRNAYLSSFSEELRACAIQLEDELSHEYDGDWIMTEDGILTKDDTDIHDEYQGQMDEMTEKTGVKYTLFWGNTRYITTMFDSQTGERMEGTTAGEVVVNTVIGQNQEYLATNMNIGNKKWYAYYLPLTNSDGSVVGMVFAGRETDDVEAKITQTTIIMVIIAVLGLGTILAISLAIMKTSTAAMQDIVNGLVELSKGDLNFSFNEATLKRNDELGVIAEKSYELKDKLTEVISTTLSLSDNVTMSGNSLSTSAETALGASEMVTQAIGDISRGAVSQSENVENSVTNTNEIGNDIDGITDSVNTLMEAANQMMQASNRTVDALEKLMTQNNAVMGSMKQIDEQIRLTNDAVKEIAEASNVITDISSQTNLLALNASIEAARAGEAGKGFAVVATEIGSLADQSGQAAVSINEIVNNLVNESQKSVDTIATLNDGLNEQNEQLNSTKTDMDGMVSNVSSVEIGAKDIAEKIKHLASSKEKLGNIITELSAISEKNAAATQETNSSVQELNATFEIINSAAADLKQLAVDLNDQMQFFKIDGI